jgi:hypothetical protein
MAAMQSTSMIVVNKSQINLKAVFVDCSELIMGRFVLVCLIPSL